MWLRYVDVRNMACFVLEQLLMLVGPKLSHDARRTIYPELLKRLDDSSNQVRVFVMCVLVCALLRTRVVVSVSVFVRTCTSVYAYSGVFMSFSW